MSLAHRLEVIVELYQCQSGEDATQVFLTSINVLCHTMALGKSKTMGLQIDIKLYLYRINQ